MSINLIKKEYPFMSSADLKKVDSFCKPKCSEYYFLDYLRSTNGNVDDAISFYYLDDELRTLFARYLIRFEIQIKTDFVRKLEKSTKSSSFWDDASFYLPSARVPRAGKTMSEFQMVQDSVNKTLSTYKFRTRGPSNYVALTFSSFGTFQSMFKVIDTQYKQDFINMYTRDLPIHTYSLLSKYLSSIRTIRNRCAHGNHIVTEKIKDQLRGYKDIVMPTNSPYPRCYITSFDAVIIFFSRRLTCKKEFQSDIKMIFNKYNLLLNNYIGSHPFSKFFINKVIASF